VVASGGPPNERQICCGFQASKEAEESGAGVASPLRKELLSPGDGLDCPVATHPLTRGQPWPYRGNMAITLKVNGQQHSVDIDPTTPLLYVLSDDLGLNGPKFGCGLGQCGACTVIVKGQAIRSCITPVKSVEGAEITTLEGLGTAEKPHPLQQAFIQEQAAQCGFCVNGVIMTAKAFLDKNPKASEQEIQQAMSGVLCRCFTHVRMLQAINRARQGMGK
jgi:nicotinate dehydrogenase subunit A